MINAPKLDRIDINILAELQTAGRITNADLADRVGLSPVGDSNGHGVAERVVQQAADMVT